MEGSGGGGGGGGGVATSSFGLLHNNMRNLLDNVLIIHVFLMFVSPYFCFQIQ